MSSLRIGVISDTHIPNRAKNLPDKVLTLFDGCDAIFHAGDFVEARIFEDLQAIAPAHGVLGNCDFGDLVHMVPPALSVELGGAKIGMIHDSGQTSHRRQKMQKTFFGHRVVIFGHSHRPMIEDDGDLLLINPGSACDPRWSKIPTVAMLTLTDGLPKAKLIEL